MYISSSDVFTQARRALRNWRLQLWSQLFLGVVGLSIGFFAPLTVGPMNWLCGMSMGLLCGTSFQYVRHLQGLFNLAERTVNSSPQGVDLQVVADAQSAAQQDIPSDVPSARS